MNFETSNLDVNNVLNNSPDSPELPTYDIKNSNTHDVQNDGHKEIKSNLISNENSEKQSAVWTIRSTTTLLKLYENKLEMLETPKKKTRIWLAISESLKKCDIEMTPDQVRWKINALAKKYKQCIDNGQHKKFRYFKEMDSIYSRFNVDCDAFIISEILKNKRNSISHSMPNEQEESKAMIELRKMRLASRIESDRTQTKLNIEKQWLQYLRQQEQHRVNKEDLFERHLKLKEEELELRRRELELKEALECKKMELVEKDLNEILQVQREKCRLLVQLFS
ncbi:zinc finger protein with KRAB and SCAN domains 2-like [Achroia grisella]|uniref:zinc finger protein with KRAB and SCAN domains 2-like n=1 Tax=Achroia grisella TaxID=688607 RepID=UPI0027D26997|nr:zinc finger protein with KRAB and SCAN domains 2-like [Achroia grisella]